MAHIKKKKKIAMSFFYTSIITIITLNISVNANTIKKKLD